MAYGGTKSDYLRDNDAHIKGNDVYNDKGENIAYVLGDGSIKDRNSGCYYEPNKK